MKTRNNFLKIVVIYLLLSDVKVSEILSLDQLASITSVNDINQLTTYNGKNVSNIVLRFTGKENNEYITKTTYFVLLFTDVRAIELPKGKEHLVLEGIKKANVDVQDVFLSYKLDYTKFGIDDTRQEIDALFKRAGLQYFDLFLIHYLDTQGMFVETWKAMIDLKHQGKIRFMGVCNTYSGYLTHLYRNTGILPSVVQLEINPFFQQNVLARNLQALGITVQAYSTLAAGQRMYEPRLLRLAKKYDMTVAQLLIKWCLQKNYSCLVTSRKLHRLAEDIYVNEESIGDDDIEILDELDGTHCNHFDPNNFEHLQSVDKHLKEKMNQRIGNGEWVVEPLTSNKHVSLPIVVEEGDENNSTEDIKPEEEDFIAPMYMSTDINTHISTEEEPLDDTSDIDPEILQIIKDENEKEQWLKKQMHRDDDENKHSNGKHSNEKENWVDNIDNIGQETRQGSPFQVKLEDISSTCQRLTKEKYERAMREQENEERSHN